jgi:hypothetical protein
MGSKPTKIVTLRILKGCDCETATTIARNKRRPAKEQALAKKVD